MAHLESLYTDIMSTPAPEEATTYFWNLQRIREPVDKEWRFPGLAYLENKFFQAPNELQALVAMEKYVQSKNNGMGFLREVIHEIFHEESYGSPPENKEAIVRDLFSSLDGYTLFHNELDLDDLRYPEIRSMLNPPPLLYDSRWPLCKGMRRRLQAREDASQEMEKYYTLSPLGPWATEDLLGVFVRAKTLPGAIAKLEANSRHLREKSWIRELLTAAEMNLATCTKNLVKLIHEKEILRAYPKLEIIPFTL